MKTKVNREKFVFEIYLVYYVLLEFFLTSSKWEKFSLLYFAIIIPVFIYILMTLPAFLKKDYRKGSLYLILMIILVALVSLVRFDIPTIYNLILFTIPILLIRESRVEVSVSLVNKLFILCIIIGIVMFHLGHHRFGYLPYIHGVPGSEPDWKISIFPRTPASGFFGLLIILLNYYYSKGKSRFIFYFLGFYFMLFSGLRSTLLIFAIFILFEIINSFIRFKPRLSYLIFGPLMIFIVILSLSFNSIIQNYASSNDGFFSSLIAKSTFEKASKAEAGDENYRTWLWGEHLAIYNTNPIFGVGSYDITDYVKYDLYGNDNFEGSESFFTRWLARIGVFSFLLLFFLWNVYFQSLNNGVKYTYLVPIFIIILMLTYGSFLMPYNFMYILIFGSLNNQKKDEKTFNYSS